MPSTGHVILAISSNNVFQGVRQNDMLIYASSNNSIFVGPSNQNHLHISPNMVNVSGPLNVMGDLMQNGELFVSGGGGFGGSSLSISGPVSCSYIQVSNGATQGNNGGTAQYLVNGPSNAFTGVAKNVADGITISTINSNAYTNFVTWNSDGTQCNELARMTYRNNQPYIGIRTTAPTHNLHVEGNAFASTLYYGHIQAVSDVRAKENIAPVDAKWAEDTISKLRVVNYNLIGESKKTVGLVAQEVESILPSALQSIDRYLPVTPALTVEIDVDVDHKQRLYTTTSLSIGGIYKTEQGTVIQVLSYNVGDGSYQVESSVTFLESGPVVLSSQLVHDFKTVDYSMIQNCTLRVVQNLLKRIAILERRIL